MMDFSPPTFPPVRRPANFYFVWKVVRIALIGGVISVGGLRVVQAQTRYIDASAPDLIEAGAPLFEVRSYQTLGLDAPPTDLHVLPDGRLLLVAGHQLAIGDGVRWERFQQAANDPLAPAGVAARCEVHA